MKKIFLIVTLLVVAAVLFFMYDKQTNSFQLDKIFDSHLKEKTEIKNQIEKAYFDTSTGANVTESPFYNNSDFENTWNLYLLKISSIMDAVKIEPKNINCINISEDSAIVSYNLITSTSDKKMTDTITMTVKKIGGSWKLDFNKSFPFINKHRRS